MLKFAIRQKSPVAIRYPRGQAYRGLEEFRAPVEYGKAEMLYEESEIALFALGSMVSTGEHVREKLKEKGQPCYEKLVALLSDEILDETGNINKVKMAEKIFSSRELLTKVNGIIHPAVKELILSAIQEERKSKIHDFFFIEAALLIEEGYLDYVDEMWYIYAREEVRRKRLKESRGYSDEKIDSIMNSQLKETDFRRYCSVVIDNSDSLTESRRQIDEKLGEYL